MNQIYMLDTNTVSYLIKGTYPSIKKYLAQVPVNHVFISAITEAELLYGLAKKNKAKILHQAVHEFLMHVDILPWDSNASKSYASLRHQLETNGTILSNLDLLIAAHSLAVDAILVTNDKAFYQIKHLRLENWTT